MVLDFQKVLLWAGPGFVLAACGFVLGRHTAKSGRDGDREKEEYAAILDQLPDATFAVDTRHRVILWNRAAESLTGVGKEEMLGRGGYAYALPFYGSPRPILLDMVLGDCPAAESSYEKIERYEDRLVAEGFAPRIGTGGLAFWSVAAPLFGPDGRIVGAVQSIRDIGERKKTEQELRYLSTHDVLTGLPNRACFEEQMRELGRRGRSVSIIVCDVDCLKLVNDTFGHLTGDDLLRRIAAGIAGELRASDIVARVGGDEFAVLLPGTDEKTARAVCRRFRERMERENQSYPGGLLGISAGCATSGPGEALEDVFRRADDAMYREKTRRGKCRYGATTTAAGRTHDPGKQAGEGAGSRPRTGPDTASLPETSPHVVPLRLKRDGKSGLGPAGKRPAK